MPTLAETNEGIKNYNLMCKEIAQFSINFTELVSQEFPVSDTLNFPIGEGLRVEVQFSSMAMRASRILVLCKEGAYRLEDPLPRHCVAPVRAALEKIFDTLCERMPGFNHEAKFYASFASPQCGE